MKKISLCCLLFLLLIITGCWGGSKKDVIEYFKNKYGIDVVIL